MCSKESELYTGVRKGRRILLSVYTPVDAAWSIATVWPQVMDEQYQTVPVRLTEKTPGVFRADYTPCTGGKHTIQVRHCTPTTPPAPAANIRSRYDTVPRLHPLHRRQTYGPGTTLYPDYTPCTGGKHTVQVRHCTPTTPPAPAANIRSRYATVPRLQPCTGGKHTVQVRHCTPTTLPAPAANIRSRYDTVRRLHPLHRRQTYGPGTTLYPDYTPCTGGKHTVQVRHCTPTTPPAPAANIRSRYDTVPRLHPLHRRQTYGPGTTLYADYTPCTGGKHTVQVRHCAPTTPPAPAANIHRLHPLHRRQTYGPGTTLYPDYTPCTGGKHTVQVRHCTPTTPPAPAANIRSRYDTVPRLHPLHRRQTYGPGTTLYADYTPCTGGKHTVQVRHCAPTTPPAPAANIRSRYDTVRRLHPLHRRQTYGPGTTLYADYTPAPAANIRSRYDTVPRLHSLHRRQTYGPGTPLYPDYTPCTGGKHTVQVRHRMPTTPPAPAANIHRLHPLHPANIRSRYDTVPRLHPLHRRQTYGPGTTLCADYTPCTGGKHTVQVRHCTPTTLPAPAANIRSRYDTVPRLHPLHRRQTYGPGTTLYPDYTPCTGGKHTVQVRHCTPTTPPAPAANIRSRYDTVRRLHPLHRRQTYGPGTTLYPDYTPCTGGKHTVQVRHCIPTTPPAPAANIRSRYDTVRRLQPCTGGQTYGPGTTLYPDYTPCTGGKHTVQVRHCIPTTPPAPAANIQSRYDTVPDYTPCTGGKHTVQVRHCTPTTLPAPAANLRSRYDTVRRLHSLHRRQTYRPGTTLYPDYTPCTGANIRSRYDTVP